MINKIENLIKEGFYHFFEAKIHTHSFSYRKWAFLRILKIVTRRTSGLEKFLLPVDIYLTNRYGKFYIPKMSDFIFTISPIAESNLLPYFTLPDSGIFLDIGANAGKYSIIIANNYPKVKTYSFEPSPFTYSVLIENLKINNLSDRVKALNIGLSDKEAIVEFASSSTYTGVSHIIDTSTGQYDRFEYEQVAVSIKSLDQVVSEENIDITSIFLIKIDVEGHELNVLKGSYNILSSMPLGSKIIIEVHPDPERVRNVSGLIEKHGFLKKQVDNENYIFTKK